jgi:hypothetical protein
MSIDRLIGIREICPYREIVHVMEADVINLVRQYSKPDVAHEPPVEGLAGRLFHNQDTDWNAAVGPVSREIRPQMRDYLAEVVHAIAVRNDDT